MWNRSIYILLFFLCTSFASDRPGNGRLWEGINAFYSYRFDESVEILSEVKLNHPEHPTIHFTWAVSKWLRAQAYNGIEASYDTLFDALDEIIPLYEYYVKIKPDDPHYRLYEAASKGLKARVHLGKKEWLSVILEGIKGYSGVLSVYKKHPELYDAYFPLGILNYYSGNMSGIVRFMSGFVGIKADKDLGLHLINISSEKGEFAWIEASQILVFIYLWMDLNYTKALDISKELVNKMPESIYNQHLFTESLIRVNRLDLAKNNLDKTYIMVENIPPLSKKSWVPTLNYQQALLAFHKKDYNSAMLFVTKSIDHFNAELDTPLGFSYLLRGMIYDLSGQRKNAVANYRLAINLDNHTVAMVEARKYLNRPYLNSIK
tara:strand:- start:6192 stop:7319 length:1128 start_codon:yes stop_codon:yes gene_type:complete